MHLDHPPRGWALTEPPEDVVDAGPAGAADLIVSFFTTPGELAERLPALSERIFPDGVLWAAWPRRAGGHTSEITDNVVRDHALTLGLVDVKVAAVDADWSGLKLVWRRDRRA